MSRAANTDTYLLSVEIESVARRGEKKKKKKKKQSEWHNSKVCEYTSFSNVSIGSTVFKFFHDARSRNENWILTLHTSVLSW